MLLLHKYELASNKPQEDCDQRTIDVWDRRKKEAVFQSNTQVAVYVLHPAPSLI